MGGGGGGGARAGSRYCIFNRLNKSEFTIFISLMWTLLPKDLIIRAYLSSLQMVLCRVVAIKRPHTSYMQIIFSGPLGSLSSF